MDGIEATRRIRAMPGGNDVTIVAVTALALEEQRKEMLAAGIDDFVRKPYRASEIYDCMTRQLGVRFVHQQAMVVDVDPTLPTESLAKLPESLRHELMDGLVLGNTKQLGSLILRVEEYDEALANVIARHVGAFNYLIILNALETVDKKNKD